MGFRRVPTSKVPDLTRYNLSTAVLGLSLAARSSQVVDKIFILAQLRAFGGKKKKSRWEAHFNLQTHAFWMPVRAYSWPYLRFNFRPWTTHCSRQSILARRGLAAYPSRVQNGLGRILRMRDAAWG
jgi:hypothetical protein